MPYIQSCTDDDGADDQLPANVQTLGDSAPLNVCSIIFVIS